MKKRINGKILIIFFAILQLIFVSESLCADIPNNQRGIGIKVKDTETGVVQDVPLYRKMHAVIIGIDKYLNLPPDKQLSYAVNDAKGVEKVLRDKYRFDKDNIYTLYNERATKSEIVKILQGELSKIDEQDAVFVFFAGHGTTQKDRLNGEDLGYILPYDGTFEKNKMYLNISMSQLRDEVAKVIPAKHIFYVIDACYSGTLLLAQRAGGVSPSRKYAYLQEITKEPVRQVLTAGTDKQTVLDGGPKGHSVFTGRFIEKLEEKKDFITARELGEYVKIRVASDAQSRGHTQTPRDGEFYGIGDFVFVPNKVGPVGPGVFVHPQDFAIKKKSVLAIAADSNGKLIAVGGIRGIELINTVEGVSPSRCPDNRTTVSLQFNPDGKKIAIGGYKEIYLLDISTGKCDKLPTQHTDFIVSLTFSPDGSALATGSRGNDRTIEIVDLNDKKIIRIFKRERDNPEEIKFLQFSPDGKLLAASSLDDKEIVKIWNVENNQPWRTLSLSGNEELTGEVVKSMAFSPDGKYLAVGLSSGNIIAYDINLNRIDTLRFHSKPVVGIGFTKDSRYLISGDLDKQINYSDIKNNTLLHVQQIVEDFNLLQIIPSSDVIKTEMIITSDKSKAYKYILPEFKEENITR